MRKHHNKLYYGKYRHKTIFKMPGSLMFYPTSDQYLTNLKKKHEGIVGLKQTGRLHNAKQEVDEFRMQDKKAIFYSDWKRKGTGQKV